MSDDIKPDVAFDDLLKLDLRLGLVKEAEAVPKSDKLIKMRVSFGSFERQIVAGVGKSFISTELVDRTLLFITNLAPRKLVGIESHGMLFAAGDGPGALALLMPFGTVPEPGSKVG